MKQLKRSMNNDIETVDSLRKKLNRADLVILAALQNDGRLTNVALAKKIHLSESACLERVKRLEEDGYIKGYTANLNDRLLGFGKVAYIQVTMTKTTEDVFVRFAQEISRSSIVVECSMVAGGFDYLLKVRFSDMNDYRSVLASVVKLPGVRQTHSYVVIEQIKFELKLPFDKPLNNTPCLTQKQAKSA